VNARTPIKAETRRCAVYTRKSSEEGLDQAFNSLHAQREACEAYVKSQIHEGWTLIDTVYDDGGFSGGSMERPALKQLLADIASGQIDVVVVYKVDRLTRSLGDFARIVETFDAAGASFVSVTQAFNTTSSMGRLTLNVLLSFAQFEREVTGERIRDKIAQSKAKGMWMGGTCPLGYDAKDRTLVINEAEATTVRMIYARYLKVGSVHLLRDELERQGVRSKLHVSAKGVVRGGNPFARGALFHLLQNRTYLGEIPHKDIFHPGLHPALLDQKLFDAVQKKLATNRIKHRDRPVRSASAPLKGLIFDAAGQPMSPSFGYGKSGRIYRYYIATDLVKGTAAKCPGDALRRLPAEPVEAALLDHLRRIAGRPTLTWTSAAALLRRVEVRAEDTQLLLDADALFGLDHPDLALDDVRARLEPGERIVRETGAPGLLRIALPRRLLLRGGRTWRSQSLAPGAPKGPDPMLVDALRRAHAALEAVNISVITASREPPALAVQDSSYTRRLTRLAFLAPDIQAAILEGAHSSDLTFTRLMQMDLPMAFEDQRRALDFA
jgi:site-specific DNA recombinase